MIRLLSIALEFLWGLKSFQVYQRDEHTAKLLYCEVFYCDLKINKNVIFHKYISIFTFNFNNMNKCSIF